MKFESRTAVITGGAAIERFGGVDIVINNAGLHLTKYNQP
jgi:NADP-dependent 3-hydroxy acid dehydrogenase YdfG